MLRITVVTESDRTVLKLEGKLAGPWVGELATCLDTVRRSVHAEPFVLDLTSLAFVDQPGKELLAELHSEGAGLIVAGPLMTALLKDIAEQHVT